MFFYNGSAEPANKLALSIQNYEGDFLKFKQSLLQSMSRSDMSDADKQFVFCSAISAYHDKALIGKKIENTPMDSIAYIGETDNVSAKDFIYEVGDMMRSTHWYETFGLNFEQTLNLPFDTYKKLRDIVPRKRKVAEDS
jgi:hypothetical protein